MTRRGHGRCAVRRAGRVEAVLGRRQRRDDRTQILSGYSRTQRAFLQGIFKDVHPTFERNRTYLWTM